MEFFKYNLTVAAAMLDSLCCAGVPTRLYFVYKRVATLGEINVPVYRDPRGQVVFGNGLVTTCDLIASNGIIHTVDKVHLMHI